VPEKADYRFGVEVVLVLGRLHWLGFNVKCSFKALFPPVVSGHCEELGQVVFFFFEVRVYKAHVAFPAAPESVALAAKFNGGVNRGFYLGRRKGDYREFGVCGSAVHKAGMAEKVRRSPQEFYAGGFLKFFCLCHQSRKVLFAFRRACAFGSHVAVMKAI